MPQFEHRQGKAHGAWRQMEIEPKQHAGKVIVGGVSDVTGPAKKQKT